MLESARDSHVGGDHKWQAGRVQEKLEQEVVFNDGVVSDNWKECGSGDHESSPERNHPGSGGSKGRTVQEDVDKVALLIGAARKPAVAFRVVSCPVL